MKNIVEPRHVLAVKNLGVSKNYYMDVLGFDVIDQHPGWLFLSRDSFVVMLGECKDAVPANEIGDHSYVAYLIVKDGNSLYEEYKLNGVEFIKPIRDEEWGMREFGITTIDGHRMMFGEHIEKYR